MHRNLVAIVLATACQARPATPAEPRPESPVERPSSTGRSSVVPERLAALQACGAAFLEIAHSSSLADAAPIYARGCKDLYREPACHEAIERLPSIEPGQRLVVVATACANAYCPRLPSRAPALCSSDARRATAHDWAQLDAQILAYEFGGDPASPAIQAIAGVMFREVTVDIADHSMPPAAPAQLQLTISVSGTHTVVGIVGGPHWSFSTDPSTTDLAPVVAALQKPPDRAEAEIVIDAAPETPYLIVNAILDALRDAGFVKVSFTIGHNP
jgi:biopolymer transport protein ExbD